MRFQRLLGMRPQRVIQLSCYLSLVGLVLMGVSVLVPRPLPVIFAMSIGQVIGAVALMGYGLGIVLDTLDTRRANSRPSAPDEPSSASDR